MRRAIVVLLPLVAVLALAIWRAHGPAPRPQNAPASEFSASRAMSILADLQREGVPHPIGTTANMRIRERVEARFRALGYDVTVQRRFACNASSTCGQVENVIARMPGPPAGDVVLLVAHYDSVGAGPGASDDGMGVATMLEVARAIRDERFRNRIAFLIDDGEEAGLLGAEAFVADEALSKDVGVVINVEMRGTYGASNLFETSRGNEWLIAHLAPKLQRPQASSLFYTIYDLLPNDTDVTVFKRGGKAAINFAAIGGVNWYHTPFDDLEHASPRTLQHHGDNVLNSVRALAAIDLAARTIADATYFDILGFHLLWWPQPWTLWIGIVSLVLLLFGARKTDGRAMTFGVLAAFATIVFAALAGAGVSWLAQRNSEGLNFVAHPTPSIIAMWLTGFAAAFLGSAIFRRKEDTRAMLYGAAIVWHMIGIALALTLPGAAYLFIVPGVAVAICALAKSDATTTSVISSTIAAILIFPFGVLLYDALGGSLLALVAVIIGAFATLVAPLFPRFGHAVSALLIALICAGISVAQPAYTIDEPQPLSLAYVDDAASGTPLFLTPVLTADLRRVAPFTRPDGSLTPWSGAGAWTAPAPNANLQRVTLTGERTGNRALVRVRTNRKANRMALIVQGGRVLRVNGVVPPPRPPRFRERVAPGWTMASASGVEEMVVEIESAGPVNMIASDTTFNLPPQAARLAQARDASVALPVHDGDVTITRSRMRL